MNLLIGRIRNPAHSVSKKPNVQIMIRANQG